jgi:hypothetical protein
MATITPAGIALVNRLDGPVQDVHRRQLGHLGGKRLKMLAELLVLCRSQTV